MTTPRRNILITGAGSGLGRGLSLCLAQQGHAILATDLQLKTPLVDTQIQDQARTRQISEEEVIQRIMVQPMPKKAFITFEEIAAAVEYLMSPLSRNVTGQTISIDGGWTAQ